MENTPLAPRQRNRRADRQVAQEPPMQQGYTPQPQAPVQPLPEGYVRQQRVSVQPVASAQPMAPAQPVASGQPVQQPCPIQQVQPGYAPRPQYPQQQSYAQSPMTMYQQPVQPQRPTSYPQPTARTPQPPVQYVSRTEAPQARATRSLERDRAQEARLAQREADKKARQVAKEKEETDAKPKKAVPGWLSTALSLSLIALMAMVAIYFLMQAYLVTQENQRIAAYKATLQNYHVTEDADGTLHVTWQDTIEKYAAQYNLQPAFVMAIIRNESSFRTGAESGVGARGLMQLMPDTAEWIAGKLDDDQYHFDRMWDAETNIRYGCWYLGYLSRLFRGDAQLVSAAYHTGQSTITQWLSDPEKTTDGHLDMNKLTDGPTKQYIGRVTQTYGIYQSLLYPDQAFDAPDAVPALSNSAAAPAR